MATFEFDNYFRLTTNIGGCTIPIIKANNFDGVSHSFSHIVNDEITFNTPCTAESTTIYGSIGEGVSFNILGKNGVIKAVNNSIYNVSGLVNMVWLLADFQTCYWSAFKQSANQQLNTLAIATDGTNYRWARLVLTNSNSTFTMSQAEPNKLGSVVAVLNSNSISVIIGATNDTADILNILDNPWSENIDPYTGAGNSDTGGGDGTFDGSSDPVDIPSLPTVGATDAGFITLFAPTSAQLHALASYCWSNLFDIDTFKKLFNDPMDCILGLSVVPVSVPTSGAREITVGNIVTTVQMNVASQQYIEVDCGSINFANKYFGSYLDYEPYTKMAIFLPYCGTHQISADDIMGKTITVKYHIDILTGSCIAFVKCGDSVLYEFNGACASNIPVNSLNYSSTIENAIRIAVNIGTTVATAGASAPLSTATEGASALSTAQNVGRGISLAGSTAEGALSMKPSVSRSGAMGGGVGLLGNQTPYIIITRPRLCKPKNQDHFEGYPSFIYSKIEDLIGQGFTSFTDVIINEQFLTDEEENELEAILKGGVYL